MRLRRPNDDLLETPPKPPYHSPFLRAVGLDALNSLLAQLRSRSTNGEPKKSIVKESLWVAFQRCGVHLLPCAVSLIVISLNLEGYFIGFELAGAANRTSQYMALLQVTAKIQELLIVASLATVIVHQTRHDLMNGPGVPFGLVGATSLFSQLSFFWSSTFFGSFSRNHGPSKRLLALILLAGIIAATAGPAVAILLIPRDYIWAAGGSTYWVSGTSDDLWPSQVGLDHYMPESHYGLLKARCNATNAYTNSLCPAGGYMALLQRLSSGYEPQSRSGAKDARYSQMNLLGSGAGTLVISQPLSGQMKSYTMISAQRGLIAVETSAVAVHGPSAWIATELGENWYDAAMSAPPNSGVRSSRYKYYRTMMSSVKTFVPAVRVVCSPGKSLLHGHNEVDFPWVPDFEPAAELENEDWGSGRVRESRTISLKDSNLQNSTFSQFPKVHRVNLLETNLTNSTTGIIFERPWTNNYERNVSGCVLDIRWAKGVVFHEFGSAPQPALLNSKVTGNFTYLVNDIFRPTSDSIKSRIQITEEVFDAVNFLLPSELKGVVFGMPTILRPNNTTSIETLMLMINRDNDWTEDGWIRDFEHAIAVLFADALARANTWRMDPGGPPHPTRKTDWKALILAGGEAFNSPPYEPTTAFTMEQQITGYSYKMASSTDWLALVAVLIHLGIASSHTIFLLVTQRSSGSWDTLPELLSLAQQSTPSMIALKNTAGGIYRLRTFRHTARIRVSENNAEHIELAFDVDHGEDSGRKPDAKHKYG